MVSIVVPISAANAEGVFNLSRSAQAGGADLVEVRLDTCVKLGADPQEIVAALPRLGLPAILTIRELEALVQGLRADKA